MSTLPAYLALRALMRGEAVAPAMAGHAAARLGLAPAAARALRWVLRGDPLRLGLDPRLPARLWPRQLRCPASGTALPVQCVAGAPGQWQTGGASLFNPNRAESAGQLTALLQSSQDAQRWYALTAGHVLAAGGEACCDELQALQLGTATRRFHARTERFLPSFRQMGVDTPIDAGLAVMAADEAQALVAAGLELPTDTASLYGGGMALTLRTRGAAWPAASVHGDLCCWMGLNGLAQCDYQLLDAVVYQCDAGTQPGDSGAALWDGLERLVGMHIGSAPPGLDGNAVAMPIAQVRAQWPGLRVATRAGVPKPPAVPLPPVSVPAAAAPAAAPSDDIDILARTVWGEARGEPDARASMGAVACVVLNRKRKQTYWGRSVTEVCLKPYQFSCWNANDPNRSQLTRTDASNREFALALGIARDALDGRLSDDTQGATHYHATTLAQPPTWARGHASCAHIGRHLFYNDIR
jgi:hypothetical protein